jgi:hypothetical protein
MLNVYDYVLIHCKTKAEAMDYQTIFDSIPVEIFDLNHGYEIRLLNGPDEEDDNDLERFDSITTMQFGPGVNRYHIDHHLENVNQTPLIAKQYAIQNRYFNPLIYVYRHSDRKPKHLKEALSDFLDLIRIDSKKAEIPQQLKSSRLYKSILQKLLRQTHREPCFDREAFCLDTDIDAINKVLDHVLPSCELYKDFDYTTVYSIFHMK